ncbi:MAG: hypothetical protein ACRBBP_06600 [Bdellovibrionales bacterium]
MKKHLFLSLLIVINSTMANASVTALGTPKNSKDFNSYLKKNPQEKSLINTVLSQKINSFDKSIIDKHALAVKGLLLEDLSPSIYLFKELAELQTTAVFSKKSQDLISESYYRLSNLERLKSNFWIKEGLFFNLDYTPSSKTFNPKIMNDFNLKHEEISNYSFKYKTSLLADSDTNFFLNGTLRSGELKLHPSGRYNLKFFKNGHKELSLDLSGEEVLKTKKVKLKKLALGTCNSPVFTSYQGVKIDKIFFSKNCIKNAKDTPSSIQANTAKPFKIHTSAPLQTEKKSKQKKGNIFQKRTTWYVIGGVILTSVLIASLNSNSGVSVEPVEH